MLSIRNADKFFNKHKKNKIHVINHTSIDMNDTGLVALLGSSGSGKTTLLNVIGGLDKVDSGTIYVNGQLMSSRCMYKVDKIRNINIGYIFQDYKLIENLSVYDNVAIVLKMIGIKDSTEIKEKVEYVLECVGMLRYKKRPVSMLSGGERQRVGIARALVKDPNIILADEPTGNLDSKNSLEIMKIIKAISEKRLVILVTHEQTLAKFYATRIIEIEDGTITRDYKNDNVEDLDYVMDSNFYLKDFREKTAIKGNNININLYRNNLENVAIDIVVKNGNIYIKSNCDDKIEVVDDNSSIEFVDDSYKKISYDSREEESFDFNKLKSYHPKKYASIINPIKMIKEGFEKVLNYQILKKILLLGFLVAGIFIIYSVSSYMATLQVKDKDFVTVYPDYLMVERAKIGLDDYLEIEKNEKNMYVMPGNSKISIRLPLNDYLQTNRFIPEMNVSLASNELLSSIDLIYGELPVERNEVVLDRLAFEKNAKNGSVYKMAGISDAQKLLNRTITIGDREYIIKGIVDKNSPCLYVAREELLPIVSVANSDKSSIKDDGTNVLMDSILRYNENKDKIELKKGRTPDNDYEVIVNINNEETMPLNKEIDAKINGKKLLVVGYYSSIYGMQEMFSNENTIKYLTIVQSKSISIMPEEGEKNDVLLELKEKKYHVTDTYKKAKKQYKKSKKKQNYTTFLVSIIILAISFVEIYLMIRSSFLSRIKEVGIYRAIGVKRIDICKMFIGEIVSITTIASIPGIFCMAYILKILSELEILEPYILINTPVMIISIILVYGFNLIIGLLPVISTIRKKPAFILSRYDLD